MIRYIMMLAALVLFCSCIQNDCQDGCRPKPDPSRTIKLPCGKKLTHISWKRFDLRYAYRDMREGEKPETTTTMDGETYNGGPVVVFEECAK